MFGDPPLYLGVKLTLLSTTGVEATDQMTMSLMFRYGDYTSLALEGFIILMMRLEKVLGERQGINVLEKGIFGSFCHIKGDFFSSSLESYKDSGVEKFLPFEQVNLSPFYFLF